jgi:cell division protein ZapA (FtsZ GTPase activity inhibitor)
MKPKNRVNLKIAGRTYRMLADETDEQILRQAEKRINKRLQYFIDEHNEYNRQDQLAKILIEAVFEVILQENTTHDLLDALGKKLNDTNL